MPCDGLASNNLKKYIGNVNFKDLNIYEINYPTANTYLKKMKKYMSKLTSITAEPTIQKESWYI